MANPILSIIAITGNVTVPSYAEQLFNKQSEAAEAQFNDALRAELIEQLKLQNYVFASDAAFEEFVADRVSLITVTDSNTKLVCLDAVIGEGDVVSDYGIILAQWQGNGFEVVFQSPVITVKQF